MVARLLHGVSADPMALQDHLRIHGPVPATTPTVLAGEIDRSGLRGRGGGAFPLARKLAAVRRARGRPTVVVNGCEGEPLSAKDRLLLSLLPHLVIDGAVCLASVVGACDILIAVDELEVRAGETIERALRQRPELRDGRTTAQVVWTPTGYLGGQETAIVRWCEEGVAKPRFGSPRVTERGVGRRPTVVSNVETAAHVALIARHGSGWFRHAGTDDDPGTALVTVGGAVAAPGVYEIEHGLALNVLLADADGLHRAAARIPARWLWRRLDRRRRRRGGEAVTPGARAAALPTGARDRVRASRQCLPCGRDRAGGGLAGSSELRAMRAVRQRARCDRQTSSSVSALAAPVAGHSPRSFDGAGWPPGGARAPTRTVPRAS